MGLKEVIYIIILFILLGALFAGVFYLWQNLPQDSLELNPYYANISKEFPIESYQFSPNMRYKDKQITFSLEVQCTEKNKNDAKSALALIQERTVLTFRQAEEGEIKILCSEVAPEPEESNHFIAGEGGPTRVIDSTSFAVILEGKVSLFRPETCKTPQIATHEILHALGFDHNSNTSSIMYPITNCAQTIDQKIIDEISRVYSTPSLPDLAIESIEANKSGRYLNFKAVIANHGLKDSQSSSLKVSVEGEEVKSFQLDEILIGYKRILTISNLQLPRKTDKVLFEIETAEQEISKEDNIAEITIIQNGDD